MYKEYPSSRRIKITKKAICSLSLILPVFVLQAQTHIMIVRGSGKTIKTIIKAFLVCGDGVDSPIADNVSIKNLAFEF